jgi:hypothetical protein
LSAFDRYELGRLISSVDQGAAEEQKVESSRERHCKADRRYLENAELRLTCYSSHVVHQQVRGGSDQRAAATEHCRVGERHEESLRRQANRSCGVANDRRAENHYGRVVEECRCASGNTNDDPKSGATDASA